jgi:2-polyprenyl-3-methyl-5-hydroxy-6-metoxy-1,4-benzoquinol methylase
MVNNQTILHEKVKRIGSVVIKYIQVDRRDAPVYCDGKQEQRLYENFAKDRNYGKSENDMKFTSWVEEYHLSPIRHNLLKWFPFNPEGTVLEVGAGCGALTGLLSQKLNKVTALEYSEQRAIITAMRHQQCSNLELIVGGLQDFVTEQKFDYITVIGVLEYAGRFYGGKDPYQSFLMRLKDLLKPNGSLILAIENKIGVKYLCGAQEDHTERIFESIYSYPYSNGVKTFSKNGLTNILNASGFQSLEWYYPLPDYKVPQQIISDETLSRDLDLIWNVFPKGSQSKYMMSEKRLAKTLKDAGLFYEFANSFLVIARIQDISEESRCIHFIGANMKRKRKFRTYKKICQNRNKLQFIVSADNEEAIEFVKEIAEREIIAKNFFNENAEVATAELRNKRLIYPYMAFPTLLELLTKEVNSGDDDFGKYWLDQYIQFVLKLPSKKCIPEEFMKTLDIPKSQIREPIHCLNCGIFDCVPHNIMIDLSNNKYYIIDNEFTYDFPIPADFLVWCAIYTLVFDLQDQIQSQVCQSHPVTIFSGHGINRHYIPLSWLSILDNLETPRKNLIRWFSAWQSRTSSSGIKAYVRLKDSKRTLRKVRVAEIATKNKASEGIFHILHKARRLL